MQEAKYYKSDNKKTVTCKLCNHYCVISNNGVGVCKNRVNKNGKLYSLNFGKPIAQNIDPIEKKPFFHFLPGSSTYSIGALGCNFLCANCQNYDISQAEELEKKNEILNYVTPMRILEEALGNGCKSISYTYSEPTIFAEYALEIMKLAHKHKLKNVWVSNGYMSKELLNDIIPYLDAINIDLKSFDEKFYKKICNSKLKPVLDNIRILKEEQVHLELTTLIIPDYSDSISVISEIADFIATELDEDTPWHLSKFSPDISWKMKNLEATSEDIIYEAYEVAKDAGVRYVYVGNIPGDQKENTYCSKCGELAIRMFGYQIERLDVKGHCFNCDRSLDIVE